MRSILSMSLLCGICLVGVHVGRAGEASDLQGTGITIDTTSGRSFVGEVDQRCDRQYLWLCRTYGSSAVLRPIQWDHVVAVELAGRRFTAEEFRSVLQTVRDCLPPSPESSANGVAAIRMVGAPELPHVPTAPTAADHPAGSQARRTSSGGPIQWLDIDVRVANWDSDVEADGLLVRICPHDAAGDLVAVDGILTVDLVGQEKSPVNRARDFVDLGRGVQQVHADDFGIHGAVYRIPFQARNPVFDTSLVSEGLVHAQLAVPGQGVVDASNCTVQFRPYNAFRDNLQEATGSRYWHLEGTVPYGR